LLLPVASTANSLPRVLTEDFSSTFAVRPAQIVPSGDGSFVIAGEASWIGRNPEPKRQGTQFGHIVWTSWTASQATATAVVWADNGVPNEADGTFFPRHVNLVASSVHAGLFTHLTLTYPGSKGHETFVLKRVGGTGYGPGYIWS